jgi:hypothetical protein
MRQIGLWIILIPVLLWIGVVGIAIGALAMVAGRNSNVSTDISIGGSKGPAWFFLIAIGILFLGLGFI